MVDAEVASVVVVAIDAGVASAEAVVEVVEVSVVAVAVDVASAEAVEEEVVVVGATDATLTA